MHSFRRALDHTSAYFFMPPPGTGPERPASRRIAPLGVRVARPEQELRAGAAAALRVLDDITLTCRRAALSACWGRRAPASPRCSASWPGWTPPSAGAVTLYTGDGPVAGPRLGRVGYMPQRDLLLPWRTALGNAVAGLEVRGVPARRRRGRRRWRLFAEFGLAGFAGSYPACAVGRDAPARVVRPLGPRRRAACMLLDEPFGALDALTRAAMQEWLLARLGPAARDHHPGHARCGRGGAAGRPGLRADARARRASRPRPDVALPRPRTLDSVAGPAFAAAKPRLLGSAARRRAACPGASAGRAGAMQSRPGAACAMPCRPPLALAGLLLALGGLCRPGRRARGASCPRPRAVGEVLLLDAADLVRQRLGDAGRDGCSASRRRMAGGPGLRHDHRPQRAPAPGASTRCWSPRRRCRASPTRRCWCIWFGFEILPKVLVVLVYCFFPIVVAGAGRLPRHRPGTGPPVPHLRGQRAGRSSPRCASPTRCPPSSPASASPSPTA